MESFREMVKGWLGRTLLVLILAVMALTGVEMYFAGGQVIAASVNGEDISQAEVDRLVERQRQQMLAQMGENADPALLDIARIREEVLNGMISRELLVQQAEKQGYLVSQATVHKLIREVPSFQENGSFSQRLYEQALRQIGENPATYPAKAKQELAYSMLVAGIAQSGIVTTQELGRLAALSNQRRDLHVALVPAARFLAGLQVSDDEVRAFYGSNPDRFTTAELVSLDYVVLKREDFLAAASVSEDELKERYEERVRASASNEQRRSQHILLPVGGSAKEADVLKQMAEIERRARAGEDFGKLAREFSQDPGSVETGGDLGLASRGMFAPAFEKALFALQEGEISAPVKTEYGYHLIKLNKIEKSDLPSLASLRPQLEREIREAKADELFGETVDKVDAAVYESSDFREPAERFKLSINSTGLFPQSRGEGPAADRRVLEAAFSDELLREGKNSQGIHLSDGRVIWIRVKQHVPPKRIAMEEVAGSIRNQLLLGKAREKAAAVARAVSESLNKGFSLDAVAAEQDLKWQAFPGATRRTQLPAPELLRTAFRLPHPASGKASADSVDLGSSYAVVAVSKVSAAEPVAEPELEQLRNVLSESRSQQEFQDYVRFLREAGDVEVRQAARSAE